MKAIMTGVAVAAVVAAVPALAAGERWQVAQSEPQAEQMQEELQSTTACPEGETVTAEGEPCPPDTASSEPATTEEGEETEAAQTEEPQDEQATEEMATEEPAAGEATEEMATEEVTEEQGTEVVAAEGGRFIEEQSDDAVLASELVGLTVYNPQDEALGDVNDIVWTEDGGVEAIIIGVGGFLGIGEKSVAVAYSQVELTTDENGNKQLRLAATEEELTAAPEFLTTAEKLAQIRAEQQAAQQPAAGGGMAPAPAPAPAQ